jgi:hypothetical protein
MNSGHFGKIHLVQDAAQFQRRETPLRGIFYDRVPIPFGASEGGDGNGQSGGRFRHEDGGARHYGGGLEEVAARHTYLDVS